MDNTFNKETLKAQYDEIKAKELRQDIKLSDNEQANMSQEQKDYHTVESATREEQRIDDLLKNAGVLGLSAAETEELKLRSRKNKNFMMVNMEKFSGDSSFMTDVKKSVRDIDEFLNRQVGNAFDRQQAITTAIGKVELGIKRCEAYLGRGKPLLFWHRKRYDAVQATKERFEDDLSRLVRAMGTDAENETVLEKTDTLLTLLNGEKVAERKSKEITDENQRLHVEVRCKVYGLNSAEFERANFEKQIREMTGKKGLDRTTAIVAYALAEEQKVLYDVPACVKIYESLEGEMLSKKTQEEKQSRINVMESFFDMMLEYDIREFDFDSYAELISSPKFKKNYLIAKSGWDSNIFVKEYRALLTGGHEGLNLKYTRDQFKEVEAKCNTMGTLGSYYDLLIAYYETPELQDKGLKYYKSLDEATVTSEYFRVLQSSDNERVKKFYTELYNLYMLGKESNQPEIMEYDVDKSANTVLQSERARLIDLSVLLNERNENADEDMKEGAKKLVIPDTVSNAEVTRISDEQYKALVEAVEYQDGIRKYTKDPQTEKIYRETIEEYKGYIEDCLKIIDDLTKGTVPKALLDANIDRELLKKKEIKDMDPIMLDGVKQELPAFKEEIVYYHKKVEQPKDKKVEWTAEENATLTLISDLTYSAELTDEDGLPLSAEKRTVAALIKNADILVRLLDIKAGDMNDPLSGLLNGLTKAEQKLLGGIVDIIEDIIEEMKKQHNGSWDPASVTECLSSDAMKEFIKTKDSDIEAAITGNAEDIMTKLDIIAQSALEGSADDDLGNLFDDEKKVTVKKDETEEEKKEREARLKEAADKKRMTQLHDAAYSKESANGKFLQKAILDYYRYAPAREKRLMMSCLMRGFKVNTSTRADDKHKLGGYYTELMKGAGPVMHKLLQGIPERCISPELVGTVRVVKSQLRPISDKYVQNVFGKMIKDSAGKIKGIKKIKSLGAASIGETFLCEIINEADHKKQVVVKILRPDAEEYIRSESEFLVRLAHDADATGVMEKSIKDQIEKVKEELDLTIEERNALMGKVYNYRNEKSGVRVRSVEISSEIPAKKEYLVMDKAEGETLDQYIADLKASASKLMAEFAVRDGRTGKVTYKLTMENRARFLEVKKELIRKIRTANKRKKHLYKMSELWCKEALFGSYFHHGDLHSGNIMISDECATLLDYGNATKFNDSEISPISKMTAAAGLGKVDLYIKAVDEILKNEKIVITQEQRQKYTEKLTEIFSLGTAAATGQRISLSILAARDCGIPIPRAMNNFSQCEQRLENAISELNDSIFNLYDTLDDIEHLKPDQELRNSSDPYMKYQNKFSGAENNRGTTVENMLFNSMNEMGITDTELLKDRLVNDKKNTITEKIFGPYKKLAAHYNTNKKAIFDVINKTLPGLKKKFMFMIEKKNSGELKGNDLSEMVFKLMEESSFMIETVPAEAMIMMGVKDVGMLYSELIKRFDTEYVDRFFSLYDTVLRQGLTVAEKYATYMSYKDSYFVKQSTKDAYRDALVNEYARHCKMIYEARKNNNPIHENLTIDHTEFTDTSEKYMQNELLNCKKRYLPVDEKGALLYGDIGERMRAFYGEMGQAGDNKVEQQKVFDNNKDIVGYFRYIRYCTDSNVKNAHIVLNSLTNIDSDEGLVFKSNYDIFLLVEDEYARERFIKGKVKKETETKYKKALESLTKAYDDLILSEFENEKKCMYADISTETKDFTVIMSDEVQSHLTTLALRLGTDFVTFFKKKK